MPLSNQADKDGCNHDACFIGAHYLEGKIYGRFVKVCDMVRVAPETLHYKKQLMVMMI
ncbi:hypothetical protein SERLADRAFT_402909 [Serpula lacrymans var. lacrymans S7.9]|uniref:Uncharacterized protein n=1 Tax=Serpula lacrymans var. lacrymans (strain S7.9) TaxID=578457 RepID=F8PCI6_SERL9|nr:uncharacterized protein SERLADRAFT_402909 [Serpula lacrymans var. lacrymans S7.9]EGO19384.1 hypothetical protein SERLADRAFT_402909 [Serpula lacrymans var. lacrymans S7.9]